MSAELPVTYPLAFPFEHKGRTVTEIRILRRAKAKDLVAADRQPGPTGREASLLAAVSDFDFAAVAEMDGHDFTTVCARAGVHFLSQSGTPTPSGASSSSSTAGPDGAPGPPEPRAVRPRRMAARHRRRPPQAMSHG